jgi:hypothetical protein
VPLLLFSLQFSTHKFLLREIWGFRRGVVEAFALLRAYAAYVGISFLMFDCLTLKMGVISCPETSVHKYQHTLSHTLHIYVFTLKLYFFLLFTMTLSLLEVIWYQLWGVAVNNEVQRIHILWMWPLPNSRYYPWICQEELEKTTTNHTNPCTYWIECQTLFIVCLDVLEKRKVSVTAMNPVHNFVTTLTELPRLLISVIYRLTFS